MPRKRPIPEPWASVMYSKNIDSRSELADRAGLHPTTVGRMIDDPDRFPSLDALRAVADTLRLDVRDVAYWCGLSMELDEPYDPPAESARLSRSQRTLVNDLIRALAETNRHPRPTVAVSRPRRLPTGEEQDPMAG